MDLLHSTLCPSDALRIPRSALRLHKYEVCPDSFPIQLGNFFSERRCVPKFNLSPKIDFGL